MSTTSQDYLIRLILENEMTPGMAQARSELSGLREAVDLSTNAFSAQGTELSKTASSIRAQQSTLSDLELVYGKNSQVASAYRNELTQIVPGLADMSSRVKILGIDFGEAGQAEGKFLQGIAAGALGVPLFAGAALAAGFAVLQLGQALVGAFEKSVKWEQELVIIQNNSGLTAKETDQMRESVLELGSVGGASLDTIALGYEHVADFGNRAAAAQEILNQAMMAGVSTGGNVDKIAENVAAGLHHYGLEASHAAEFTGVVFLAAQKSKSSVEEFAASLDRSTGIAAGAGVAYQEVAAAQAALTVNGFPAAQATTQLVDMLERIPNPTKEASAELLRISKLTGVDLVHDFTATGLASKGLKGVIDDIRLAFEKMGLNQAQARAEAALFISAMRGGQGLQALVTNGYADMAKNLSDFDSVLSGTTPQLAAFNREQKTTQAELDRTNAAIQQGTINLGKFIETAGRWVVDPADMMAQVDGLGKFTVETTDKMAEGASKVAGSWAASSDGVTLDVAHQKEAIEGLDGALGTFINDASNSTTSYQDFVKGSMDSASARIIQHESDYETLKARLESNLSDGQKLWDFYANRVDSATKGASASDWEHYRQVSAAQAGIRGELAASEQEWANYYAAAGGSLIQRFNTAKISLQSGQNAATVADADAKAAQDLADNARATQNTTKAKAAQAHADTEAAKAAVAHSQSVLDQSKALDTLRGVAGKSNDTMHAEAQLARDNAALTQKQTSEINANTKATIASQNAAGAKKADTAADATRNAQGKLEELKATTALEAAQKALNDKQNEYRVQVDASTLALHQLERAQRDGLEIMQAVVDKTSEAATAYAEKTKAEIKSLDETLYKDAQAIYEIEQRWKGASAAAQAEVSAAQGWLDMITGATTRQNQQFDRQAHDLQSTLDPLNDALEQQQRAYQALSDSWENRIIPLQTRLNALKESERKLDATDGLHKEQVGVENLAAQLATATGARRTQIQFEIDRARQRLDLHRQEESLQSRINAMQADKEKDLRIAQLQMRATQDRITAIQDEQKLLERQRAEYDYQQEQKRIAAQNDLDAANRQAADVEKRKEALEAPYKAEAEAVAHSREVKAHDAQATQDELDATAKKAKENYDFVVKNVYDPQKKAISDHITDLQDEAKAATGPDSPLAKMVKFYQEHVKDITGAENIINVADQTLDKGGKLSAEMQGALEAAHNVLTTLLPDLPDLATSYAATVSSTKTSSDDLITKGITPLAYQFDRTKTDSLAGMWDLAFDYDKNNSLGKQLDTSLHNTGNAMIIWAGGQVAQLKLVEAEWTNLINKSNQYMSTAPGSTPSSTGGNPYAPYTRNPQSYAPPVTHQTVTHETHLHFNGQPIITKQDISDTLMRAFTQKQDEWEIKTGRTRR